MSMCVCTCIFDSTGIMSGVMNPFLNWVTLGSGIKAFHPRNPAWAAYFLGLCFVPHTLFVAHSFGVFAS